MDGYTNQYDIDNSDCYVEFEITHVDGSGWCGGTIQIETTISSESGYDYGYVYSDGVEKSKHSGSFTDVISILPPDSEGDTRRIKFRYKKDSSAKSGNDRFSFRWWFQGGYAMATAGAIFTAHATTTVAATTAYATTTVAATTATIPLDPLQIPPFDIREKSNKCNSYGGDDKWTYSGNGFSAASPMIGQSNQQNLRDSICWIEFEITRRTSTEQTLGQFWNGDIQFSTTISSESCCDKGYVYEDGVLLGDSDGQSGSGTQHYDIQVPNEGETRTLKFRYKKDGTKNFGDDQFSFRFWFEGGYSFTTPLATTIASPIITTPAVSNSISDSIPFTVTTTRREGASCSSGSYYTDYSGTGYSKSSPMTGHIRAKSSNSNSCWIEFEIRHKSAAVAVAGATLPPNTGYNIRIETTISSEEYNDRGYIFSNDVKKLETSGTETKTVVIPLDGRDAQYIRFKYAKDSTLSEGEDKFSFKWWFEEIGSSVYATTAGSSRIKVFTKGTELKCETVYVGKSENNKKTVEFNDDSIPNNAVWTCFNEPQNKQESDWYDTFEASTNGLNELTVERTDSTSGGWGQPLELKCCYYSNPDSEYGSSTGRTTPGPNSASMAISYTATTNTGGYTVGEYCSMIYDTTTGPGKILAELGRSGIEKLAGKGSYVNFNQQCENWRRTRRTRVRRSRNLLQQDADVQEQQQHQYTQATNVDENKDISTTLNMIIFDDEEGKFVVRSQHDIDDDVEKNEIHHVGSRTQKNHDDENITITSLHSLHDNMITSPRTRSLSHDDPTYANVEVYYAVIISTSEENADRLKSWDSDTLTAAVSAAYVSEVRADPSSKLAQNSEWSEKMTTYDFNAVVSATTTTTAKPSSSSGSSSSSTSSKLSGGAIAGIVIGVLVFCGVCVAGIVILIKSQGASSKQGPATSGPGPTPPVVAYDVAPQASKSQTGQTGGIMGGQTGGIMLGIAAQGPPKFGGTGINPGNNPVTLSGWNFGGGGVVNNPMSGFDPAMGVVGGGPGGAAGAIGMGSVYSMFAVGNRIIMSPGSGIYRGTRPGGTGMDFEIIMGGDSGVVTHVGDGSGITLKKIRAESGMMENFYGVTFDKGGGCYINPVWESDMQSGDVFKGIGGETPGMMGGETPAGDDFYAQFMARNQA